MTTAQDGCKFVSLTQRPPLRPGKFPVIQLCYVYIYMYRWEWRCNLHLLSNL